MFGVCDQGTHRLRLDFHTNPLALVRLIIMCCILNLGEKAQKMFDWEGGGSVEEHLLSIQEALG